MSHEIQLAPNTPATADFWTQGQSLASSNASANKNASIFRKAHRLLRGRYPIAVVLAAAGAVAGAVAGFSLTTPKYQSNALIEVNPVITSPLSNDGIIPMFSQWIASQAALIQSANLAEDAGHDKDFSAAWAVANKGAAPNPVDVLAAIDAEHIRNSNVIQITFTDRDPNVAKSGARAVTSSYMRLYANNDNSDRRKKIDFLDRQQTQLLHDLKDRQNQLKILSEKFGTVDLGVLHTDVLTQLSRAEAELTQSQIALDTATALQNGHPANDPNDHEYVIQQIAAVDNTMRNFLNDREQMSLNLEATAATYGKEHKQYKNAQMGLDHAKRRVDDYAKEYIARNYGRVPVGADEAGGGNLLAIKAHVESVKKLVETNRQRALEIGSLRMQIDQVQADITKIQADLSVANARIDMLGAQQQLTKSFELRDPGSDAIVSSDKRKLAAGVGFVFGGFLPVALLMLYGLVDSRFRFSDDANSTDLSGVNLLGILPNLPDRLSDPEQAGIAAHCVHQIRTILQINRTTDEPQVLAVTSAAPGDGKTSLTLALGLSYAACGARTLLVDCDLVAAGLTNRLNVSSTDGVLEAVANRALLEYVRTTDIADVAILPVGTTHAHHASTLSPVALRRLLSEAKRHFDVILVDTGPILGSIEASLVCAAADRTILTVARGQLRPLVEKSIEHLNSIGARIAGVVFNRAQASDFERSMNGLALRSRPMNGAGPRTTAADKAVAGTIKRAS